MPIETVYHDQYLQVNAGQASIDEAMDMLRKKLGALQEERKNVTPPRGIDALSLLAFTNGAESWYGAKLDKAKYAIVLEDETEDSVYLKIIRKQSTGEVENA